MMPFFSRIFLVVVVVFMFLLSLSNGIMRIFASSGVVRDSNIDSVGVVAKGCCCMLSVCMCILTFVYVLADYQGLFWF